MKSYIKHMSKQTHRIPTPKLPLFDRWLGYILGTCLILWLLKWPILFIISLFY